MTRIRCFYEDCIFLQKGICTAAKIELDPDEGCMTYSEDPEDINASGIDDDMDTFEEESWEDAGFEELSDLDFEEDF